jgi:hypothetical protein
MCFCFVFTVFSTVGFGDIYASNTSERVRLLADVCRAVLPLVKPEFGHHQLHFSFTKRSALGTMLTPSIKTAQVQ